MIRLRNLTPFAFGYRLTSRKPPQRELVGIVRAKFRLAPGAPLEPVKAHLTDINHEDERLPQRAREQLERAELALGQGTVSGDRFDEDDVAMQGALRYASDLADFKLNGEWLVKAHCHAPGGKPVTSCNVCVAVNGRAKTLRVTGPRAWVDRVVGGAASEPVAFSRLPIDWEHAYGGPDFPSNPVGRGHALERPLDSHEGIFDLPEALRSAFGRTHELPTVEDPSHLITRQGTVPNAAGFGPISPWWPSRQAKLGKEFGEEYEAKYAPFYPRDFDWTYFQAAPPDQQLPGYFRGDESLTFTNLHPTSSEFSAKLPGQRVRVFVMRSGAAVEVPMVLDTVYADLDAGELTLTWRGLVTVSEDDFSDVPYALVASEPLTAMPRPAAEYVAALDAFAADPAGLSATSIPVLQALKDDLDSGALARDIEALSEDEELMGSIATRIGRGLIPDDKLALLQDGLRKATRATLARNPGAGRSLKRAALAELERGQDLPALPVANDGAGSRTLAPLVRRLLGDLALEQRRIPEVDWEDMNESLEGALASKPDAGVRTLGTPGTMKALSERTAPEPGPHADFSWLDLRGRDFRGYDLTDATFEGATLIGARLDGCTLEGANFEGASLSRANLSGVRARGARFVRAIVSRANVTHADLRDATLEEATLLDADFTGARLQGMRADRSRARKTTFATASLEGASFEFCIFDECDLRDATLSRSNGKRTLFRQCALARARLDGADLSRAGFIRCDLTEARLFQAFGVGTNWMMSTLVRANLRHAVLPENLFLTVNALGANLWAADLPGARFYKANLRNANLEHANLLGADMRKAVLTDCALRHANLYDAKILEAAGTDVDFRSANMKKALLHRSKLVTK
jgi:uncharacterized protein YjbI with pentapeptide repeats